LGVRQSFRNANLAGDSNGALAVARSTGAGGANCSIVNMEKGMIDRKAAMVSLPELIGSEPESHAFPIYDRQL